MDEVAQVLGWAAAEGWNPGLDDAATFYVADPAGYFIAVNGDTPVAAISVVNHGPDHAFLGLYLCHPDYRGQGIGLALWQHAITHAGGRTIGLDGVPDQQDNYRKSGFKPTGKTTRFIGTLPADGCPDLRPVGPGDVAALVAMEQAASGIPKSGFLSAWFVDAPTRKTLIHESDGVLRGAVTYRQCQTGYKIGPLIADDPAIARALVKGVGRVTGNEPVSIDVPAESPAIGDMCREWDMKPGFETARMYRGQPPTAGALLYCVATLELG